MGNKRTIFVGNLREARSFMVTGSVLLGKFADDPFGQDDSRKHQSASNNPG
jgi:hypothetical protein